MNKKALVFAVAAACLTSGAAVAQTYASNASNGGYERQAHYERDGSDDSDERRDDYYRQYGSSDSNYGRQDGYQRGDRYNRYDRYNGDQRYSRRDHQGYRNNGYHVQPRHQHRRGGYLAHEYRNDRYVVNDWRNRGLYQPQYGQQWVQAGNRDYLLVAIATGLITQMLVNR